MTTKYSPPTKAWVEKLPPPNDGSPPYTHSAMNRWGAKALQKIAGAAQEKKDE